MDAGTIKIIVLVTLTIQNAGQSLVLTQSRIPNIHGQTYDASIAVFLQEILKSLLSLAALLYVLYQKQAVKSGQYTSLLNDSENSFNMDEEEEKEEYLTRSKYSLLQAVQNEVLTADAIRIILPATLYVAQNHLQLYAASRLDATNYAVLSQIKIITTAIFTVTLLGRTLNSKQWASVFGVFVGVILVQISSDTVPKSLSKSHAIEVAGDKESLKGLLALFASCTFSGFAGVYTERVLTQSKSSIFANSLQMSLCSLIPAATPIGLMVLQYIYNGQGHAVTMFAAFGAWAWLAVLYNVWGGFTVVFTMKLASSLAKSFATSVAVVITFLFSFFFLHNTFAPLRLLGAAVVVASVYSYSVSATVKPNSLPEVTKEQEGDRLENRHFQVKMFGQKMQEQHSERL